MAEHVTILAMDIVVNVRIDFTAKSENFLINLVKLDFYFNSFKTSSCGKEFTPCHFITCMNGGKCTMHENIPYCKCPNNRFIGTRCEIGIL